MIYYKYGVYSFIVWSVDLLDVYCILRSGTVVDISLKTILPVFLSGKQDGHLIEYWLWNEIFGRETSDRKLWNTLEYWSNCILSLTECINIYNVPVIHEKIIKVLFPVFRF